MSGLDLKLEIISARSHSLDPIPSSEEVNFFECSLFRMRILKIYDEFQMGVILALF